MRKGGKVPDKLIETVFGKGNRSVVDMMYSGTSKITVKNVCRQVIVIYLKERKKNYEQKI